jgi:hypothetical protein
MLERPNIAAQCATRVAQAGAQEGMATDPHVELQDPRDFERICA